MIQAAQDLSRARDPDLLNDAARLWDQLGAAEVAEHCRLRARGYLLLESWEGRSERMRRAFHPLRLALDRGASRETLERAVHEVQREIRYSRGDDGPDPGQGVPRRPKTPDLPGQAARLP